MARKKNRLYKSLPPRMSVFGRQYKQLISVFYISRLISVLFMRN